MQKIYEMDCISNGEQMKNIKSWLLVIAYACLIFYLSSQPYLAESIPPEIEEIDPENIILHICEYSILGFLLLKATGEEKLFLSFALGSFYGITDEIHQSFVPNRTSSPIDAIADSVGIIMGIYLRRKLSVRGSHS